ncbi:hypothetical protein OR1_02787 [Geobacter sp. OR-1]|uniref:hypothetical protein n=1 Tax=Geobacter sp. OR-1 TaxID=1266765 RepID=UPI000542137B|nr:hypothetical protein [Geobacter sp. OR-1]GAM10498.1 hypothetical protein OR1_02787 [Geobacter sp. OR-1]
MRMATPGKSFLLLVIILLVPTAAIAAPTISCHCFKDRGYDPAQPTLADPYFLATAQNSLFAAVFGVDKKNVVLKKQLGTSSDDLWIAYWIALKTGKAAEPLLQQKESGKSWREIVTESKIPAKSCGPSFAAALQNNARNPGLAETVVNELLSGYRLLSNSDLTLLRKSGASNQELIIAALLAAKTKQQAIRYYHEVKTGAKSWGALLASAGIEPPEIQEEFAALLRAKR